VLVEGPSKKAGGDTGHILQLTGRTMCDRIVVFQGTRRQVGQIVPVFVGDCTEHTLIGDVVTREKGPEVYSLDVPQPAQATP
jgi:tRNA-2-methylthio-N6-dimethylallyladenosine synthase